MKHRLLFLDDDQERHVEFRRVVHGDIDVTYVYSVAQAKAAIDGDRFDEMWLDHDLADYGPSDMYGYCEEYTGQGQRVARYVVSLAPEKMPAAVRVHSWNPDGARAMAWILGGAGVPTVMRPFTFGGERMKAGYWVVREGNVRGQGRYVGPRGEDADWQIDRDCAKKWFGEPPIYQWMKRLGGRLIFVRGNALSTEHKTIARTMDQERKQIARWLCEHADGEDRHGADGRMVAHALREKAAKIRKGAHWE